MIHYKEFDIKAYEFTVYPVKDRKTKEVTEYCNDIITLDFETTSYYILKDTPSKAIKFDFTKSPDWYIKNTIPQACMYIWMMGINDVVVYGRTYDELYDFITKLSQEIQAKFYIYIHNLSFDFHFLLNCLGKECEVFARKEHKPIKVFYEHFNVEFRCSLFLTNKSLREAIKDCNAPIEKLVGDLDYNVIRTPLTTLTDKELAYCNNDILGLYYVILDKRNTYHKIKDIPLTQTGQVRKACKMALWSEKAYIEQVKYSWPKYDEFKLLCEAYYGGYVHANAKYTNRKLTDIYSYDITSSYPYVLCTMKYPTGAFYETYETNLDFLDTENNAYIMDITLFNVEPKTKNTFLSVHKSFKKDFDGSEIVNKKIIVDNGRIKECNCARFKLTDQDLIILNNTYKFTYRINAIFTAKKDYLPKKLIEFILKYFKNKTLYKNVEGFDSLYKEAKEFINSIYGMFVTKIISDDIDFNTEDSLWKKTKISDSKGEEKLDSLGEEKQFFCYSTGVWCAAYARKHLWDLIIKMDKDVIYCDTDSIKFKNKDNIKYFEEDNKKVDTYIMSVCIARDLNPEDYKVAAPDGKICKLGYFEEDGIYKQFKTLGAKKYAYTLDKDYKCKVTGEILKAGAVHITVAGVNKITGRKYFKKIEDFKPKTLLNYEYAGKKLLRYNDKQQPFTFEDGYTTEDRYGVVLTPTTYLLNITDDYESLLLELENENSNYNVGEGTELL